ncbi:hypothetical protein GCM10009000_036940 [Halobacterium noricense]
MFSGCAVPDAVATATDRLGDGTVLTRPPPPYDVRRDVHGTTVVGVAVGPETRCAHYDGPTDVIALRLGCCERFVPCVECHDAVADHGSEPWPRDRFDEPAVLCGACGATLSVEEYLDTQFACPECEAAFNPGCAAHYDRYFEGVEPNRTDRRRRDRDRRR